MRTPAIVLLALSLATSAIAPVSAQAPRRAQAQPRRDSGFWYSISAGPGWARLTCSICAGSRRTGISAALGLGGSTSRMMRIGGEFAAWRESHEGVTQTLLSVGAAAYWYPSPRQRLYLRGGAAFLMHRANDGTDVVTSSGIGPQLGIGSEYRAGRSWLIAPFIHYAVGVFGGDVKFNGGQAANSATVSFLQVGASLRH